MIEHIEARIGDRPPDRDRTRGRDTRGDPVNSAADDRFRRTVFIIEECRGSYPLPAADEARFQIFSPYNKCRCQRSTLPRGDERSEQFQMRRRDLDKCAFGVFHEGRAQIFGPG